MGQITEQPVSGAVDELPPLPEPIGEIVGKRLTPQDTDEFWGYFRAGYDTKDKQRVFTADQLQDYARAAVALSRAQQAPQESLKVIAAARTEIIKSIRAYGEKSCADYIDKWLQPDHIAVLIAAAKEPK